MKKKNLKKIISAVFFIFSLHIFGSQAWAQKRCANYITVGTSIIQVPVIKATISDLQIPEFNPGDYKIGERIGNMHKGTVTIVGGTEPKSYCYSSGTLWMGGVGPIGAYQAYPTSIAGIGVRLSASIGVFPQLDDPLAASRYTYWNTSFNINLEIIKTGDITAAGVLHGPFMHYRIDTSTGSPLLEFSFPNPINITPRVPTCSVANSYQLVNLEKINPSEVNVAGIIPTKTKSFNIQLKCSGGDRGTSTRAFVTLTDANQANNVGTVLTLQKNGLPPGDKAAEGIGIQIMKEDNTVLGFGPESSETGNTNQWFAKQIPQAPGTTDVLIPLKAGYVKTGVPIKAGKVYAQAIFTMSYQ